MNKKIRNQLLVSSISLCTSLILLAFASFAWLSSNREVGSNGMEMQVESTPNLAISLNAAELRDGNLTTLNGGNPSLVTTTATGKYSVCTHDSAVAIKDTITTESALKYVTNTDKVDLVTGLERDMTGLILEPAMNSQTQVYYVDQTVYIASFGQALPCSSLKAKIVGATLNDTNTSITSGPLMATSVDFYLVSATNKTYLGTSSVAGNEEVTILGDDTIPLNTEGNVAIMLRYYFDGAKLKDSTHTYITTATVNSDKVTVNVKFTANE